MNISHVLVVSPPDYTHSQCFYDIAMSFSRSLQTLGHDAILTLDSNECDGTTLVFGAHLVSKLGGTMKGDYIIYQTEQIKGSDSLFVDDPYFDLLSKFQVWDYSLENIKALATHGIDAIHVPIGYNKSLTNIPSGRSVTQVGGGTAGQQRLDFAVWSGVSSAIDDIDVCFYGSLNERRQKIINELKSSTVPTTLADGTASTRPLVVASFTGYGAFRDRVLRRSKLVLNMHYYDSAIFETFRMTHVIANRIPFVSELGNDAALEEPYYNTGNFCKYESLVSTVKALLTNDIHRISTGDRCFDVLAKNSQIDILKGIL